MAPEQARGQPVDGRADLFSLGMVMYHLLTGESLYNASTTAEAFYQATTGLTADQPGRLRNSLPGPMVESEAATLMSALLGDDLRRQTASLRAKIGALPDAAKSG
jgi:serine/threonine protein kinase